jgi:lycopene cyclase domain-containing protein
MSYTALVIVGIVGAVILDLVVLRTRLLGRKSFWTAYAIVVFFQLLTNSWLTGPWRWSIGDTVVRTGAPVVNYDEASISGIRIAHAPIEDLGFGFALVLMTLSLWIFWGRHGVERD